MHIRVIIYMTGIYKITDLNSNNFYIGSSININNRWKRHLSQLKNHKHSNYFLQKLFNFYGASCFSFEIVELCKNLKEREQYYLDTLNPKLNINKNSSGGDMISNHPLKEQIKQKHLINTRKAASSKSLKQKRSKNAKLLYPDGPMCGKKHSENTKNKMSKKRGTKIKIDDKVFDSLRKAAEFYKTNHHTIMYRVLSSDYKNYMLF